MFHFETVFTYEYLGCVQATCIASVPTEKLIKTLATAANTTEPEIPKSAEEDMGLGAPQGPGAPQDPGAPQGPAAAQDLGAPQGTAGPPSSSVRFVISAGVVFAASVAAILM